MLVLLKYLIFEFKFIFFWWISLKIFIPIKSLTYIQRNQFWSNSFFKKTEFNKTKLLCFYSINLFYFDRFYSICLLKLQMYFIFYLKLLISLNILNITKAQSSERLQISKSTKIIFILYSTKLKDHIIKCLEIKLFKF